MQYAIALEMKYKRLRYSQSLTDAVVSQKQYTTACYHVAPINQTSFNLSVAI